MWCVCVGVCVRERVCVCLSECGVFEREFVCLFNRECVFDRV